MLRWLQPFIPMQGRGSKEEDKSGGDLRAAVLRRWWVNGSLKDSQEDEGKMFSAEAHSV